jgi:hypothetical protein
MIELLQQYGKAFLWSDGYHITGLAMTLWLLVVSIAFGFTFAIPVHRPRLAQPADSLAGAVHTISAARRCISSCWSATPASTAWPRCAPSRSSTPSSATA